MHQVLNKVAGHSQEELIERGLEELRKLPGSEALASRYRALELMVINRTSYTLEFSNRFYLCSGEFISRPAEKVKPGTVSVYTAANVAGGVLQGITGAVQYKIQGSGLYLHIGFCNPSIGTMKYYIGASADKPAQYGYDNCVTIDGNEPLVASSGGFRMTAEIHEPINSHQLLIFTLDR